MFRLELVSRLHQTPAIVRAQTGWRNAEIGGARDSQEKKVVENHRRVLMHEQQRADDATAQAESAVRGLLGPFARNLEFRKMLPVFATLPPSQAAAKLVEEGWL